MVIKLFSYLSTLISQLSSPKGQMLVELVMAIGIAAIILPALLTGLVASRAGKPQQQQRLQATTLLNETENAVRSVSNSDWNAFAINGTFHPVITNNKWTLSSGSATVNTLTQSVVISDVQRDPTGAIVTSGGSTDPSTKKAIITISWTQPTVSSVTSTLYLTRTTNLTYKQTTETEFNAGTGTGTAVTNTSGGEVELGAGNANWCRPQNYVVNQVSLPKLSNALYGVTGHAYLGAGDGTSGSPMFINVGINTPAPPATPSASITGTFNGDYTTNAIFSDGNYAYLATTDPVAQGVILDISHTPYTQVGTITIPGGNPANGVYVVGDILYVTSGDMFYSFDISNKTGSHTVALGSKKMITLFGYFQDPQARQIVVVNNKVYIGAGDSFFGLQIFTIKNGGSSFSFDGVANFTFLQQSQGLYVNSSGTRAYIAFNNGVGGWASQGFFIVDVSQYEYWFLPVYGVVGRYSATPMNPTGMTIVPGNNRAIIVGTGISKQYQIVDISNESDPTLCGSMDIPSGVYGVSSILDQYSNAYSYITTGESGDQFKIIQGGNGGNFSASGTFESKIFDAGYSSAFNRFSATIAQPSQTTIKMQVAVANAVSGSCIGAAFTYVGPDGNSSSYFTPVAASISAQIPFGNYNPNYQNPAQCFRYKVYLDSTDTSQTPVLYDVTTNYSQ